MKVRQLSDSPEVFLAHLVMNLYAILLLVGLIDAILGVNLGYRFRDHHIFYLF